MTEERVERLPKWAQQRIAKLEADIDYWRKQAHQATVEGESDTILATGMREDDKALPSGSKVRFKVAPTNWDPEACVECQCRDGRVRVFCSGRASVLMESANVFEIVSVGE